MRSGYYDSSKNCEQSVVKIQWEKAQKTLDTLYIYVRASFYRFNVERSMSHSSLVMRSSENVYPLCKP